MQIKKKIQFCDMHASCAQQIYDFQQSLTYSIQKFIRTSINFTAMVIIIINSLLMFIKREKEDNQSWVDLDVKSCYYQCNSDKKKF